MKKSICLLLAAALCLTLWGCGTDDVIDPAPSQTQATIPSDPTEAPTEPPAEPVECNHAPEILQTTPATCTTAGQVLSSCPLCGEEFTQELPALGHSFSDATCTEGQKCSICGFVEGDALGHSYADGECTICGHQLPQDIPADCSHEYTLTQQIAATCTAEGRMDYQCTKCNHSYCQSIPAMGHQYLDATCTAPSTCKVCGSIQGQALGHSYENDACIRCGAADPDASKEVTYTVTIRSDKGAAVEGVTVAVYNGGLNPAAIGTTNAKGVATMTIMSADSYRVVLSNVPAGLAAKESYTFKSTRVNINLSTVSVISPTDHSQANYKLGSIMGDFTLTDTDGNSYTLSQLLQEKDLVILNFWFVNCGPCKAEFPYFEAIHNSYDNVQLLTMNHIDSQESIIALREQMGVTFPMISENIGFQQGFGIYAYPTTVFIDSTGKILKIQVGDFKSQAELESWIEQFT